MDKIIACHNIATNCARMFVESNAPEYKVKGYSKLIEDFTTRYSEAYQQAEEQLKDLSQSKVKIQNKASFGL